METRCLPLPQYVLLCVVILGVTVIATCCIVAVAIPKSLNQELHGFLEDDHGKVYILKDLKKGDTVYAYMTNTRGNLDPMLGVFKTEGSPDFHYEEVLEYIRKSEKNFLEVFFRYAREKFVVWDDDSGTGYDAELSFSVPADGDYYIFAGSMITNQALDVFEPTFTFGSYKLSFAINESRLDTLKDEPSGKPIATIDSQYLQQYSHVQKIEIRLTDQKPFSVHYLRNLKAGETLYVRLVSSNDQLLPRLFLGDFGGKPLLFSESDETGNAATISYNSQEDASDFMIVLNGSDMANLSEGGEYTLVAGINAPEVLQGETAAKGLEVLKDSHKVKIGLTIDQIANVNQQSENLTIVGSLQMIWKDPGLAFSPDKCGCAIKMMTLDALIKSVGDGSGGLLPAFTFMNQQGNRWSGSQDVYIEPSGQVTYVERFTVTLQAPGFDFRLYPFDKQTFHAKISLNVPTEIFTFEEIENPGDPFGTQLGEEEWSITNYSQEITEVPFGRNLTKSQFSTTFEMNRHLNYYVFRIIMPLLLILGVSWIIFFLKDYGKQLEVASGNLLVFVAFNFTISSDLPRLGYLTLLDRMIITSFCCTAVVVFISVYQKRLEAQGRTTLASYIDKVVLTFYPLVYVVLAAAEYFFVISEIKS